MDVNYGFPLLNVVQCPAKQTTNTLAALKGYSYHLWYLLMSSFLRRRYLLWNIWAICHDVLIALYHGNNITPQAACVPKAFKGSTTEWCYFPGRDPTVLLTWFAVLHDYWVVFTFTQVYSCLILLYGVMHMFSVLSARWVLLNTSVWNL
jgi:hypothetical protein